MTRNRVYPAVLLLAAILAVVWIAWADGSAAQVQAEARLNEISGSPAPGMAAGDAGSPSSPGDVAWQVEDPECPLDTRIMLRFAEFDPIRDGEPDVPGELRASAESDVFIVQFCGPPTDETRRLLEEVVDSIHFYLPHIAHIVRMDPDVLADVEALDFVRWVGPYHPAYKLEEELVDLLSPPPVVILSFEQDQGDNEGGGANGTQGYSIMLLEGGAENLRAFAQQVRDVGGV